MKYSPQSVWRFFYYYMSLCFFLSFTACIDEDNSNCSYNKDFFLHIKAKNAKGEDVTGNGDAGHVQLYVFDESKLLIDQISVSSEDVKNSVPVRINNKDHTDLWVVAWSNLNGKQDVVSFAKATDMKQAFVQLRKNNEGYAINPDDLFFGIENVNQSISTYSGFDSTRLEIVRKTALMNITVKGLDPQYSDYYFVIKGSEDDAYDFEGNLVGNPIEYKQIGAFDSTRNFYSSDIFSLYPLKDGNRILIYVYKGTDLIVIADKNDKENKDIIPMEGLTNNIFIVFDKNNTSSVNVNVKVTDWDEKFQWVEW